MAFVGGAPVDLGLIDLSFDEMLFWQYCPIFVPGELGVRLPSNLEQFWPIVEAAILDLEEQGIYYFDEGLHIYLTAKTLWVQGGYIGNRHGWHTDGFSTDDINYIWSSRAPTEFYIEDDPMIEVSDDHYESMDQMRHHFEEVNWKCPHYPVHTYPDKHLLRLDPTVMHRCADHFEDGMRTFVKVSVSKHQYNLKGNSINHDLPRSHWPLVDRAEERNHPTKES